MQNMDHVHAHDCHQNMTEAQATEYHTKNAHMCTIGTVSQA